MKKYKIVYSTNVAFQDIELPFDFEGLSIGSEVDIFNTKFKITQMGSMVQCVNETWVLTFQEEE